METILFVYGTLRTGEKNHRLMNGSYFIGNTTTKPQYSILDLGEYPGLIEGGSDSVPGEVWLVSSKNMSKIDQLENVAGGLFRRQPVNLTSCFGYPVVETYFYRAI